MSDIRGWPTSSPTRKIRRDGNNFGEQVLGRWPDDPST